MQLFSRACHAPARARRLVASLDASFSGAAAASGTLVAHSGVDHATPVAASSSRVNLSGTLVTAATVTAPAGSMLVGFFGTATNATFTPPSGMIERGDVAVTSGSFKVASEATDQLLVTAGSTGNRTAMATKGAVSIGQLIALKPAP